MFYDMTVLVDEQGDMKLHEMFYDMALLAIDEQGDMIT